LNCWPRRIQNLFKTAGHDGLHFLQSRAGHGEGVAFPVFAVEQLQRQYSAEADASKIAQERFQRCNAFARIEAIGIGDGGAGRIADNRSYAKHARPIR
jgi:glycerol dehydrogenase-like iron-containing ADH family enzyme